MKLMRNITLIAVAAVLLVAGGCKTEPRIDATPAELARIEMMQKVPVFYEDFEFWDVKKLREDPDMAEMYQVWYERKVKFLEERYGIDSTKIKYLAQGEGLLDIFIAEYGIDALRGGIAADFKRDTSYQDIEVWKSEPASDPQSPMGGWVLAEGLLVRGANNSNVDDYLRVAKAEELSMYDKNAADLLKKLPEGLLTTISRSSSPKGSIVSGMSVSKEEKSTLIWTNAYEFQSDEAARQALSDVYFTKMEDDFKNAQTEMTKRGQPAAFRAFSIKQEGKFVKWSMLVDEKYMIGLLFYG